MRTGHKKIEGTLLVIVIIYSYLYAIDFEKRVKLKTNKKIFIDKFILNIIFTSMYNLLNKKIFWINFLMYVDV